ncbi:MAG: helicase-related protein [Rhodospirillales bacterium]|tara:strand:- start:894 stop:3452 length:2559 start_codon:yes stop_codon:yes gene_type:complete
MQINTKESNIIAVLGPTNTGKTYFAMERLLGHGSGMIGFPLRLLARENYDRAVSLKGPQQVALVTGEEKIIPRHAKYFFCTVESMPLTNSVDFIAIDEVQLCTNIDRGHIFTDRLLRARGRSETMFMGSESVKNLLVKLIPNIKIIMRPRFSRLLYKEKIKIARLPRRTAIVGFSASDVYAIAELVRRQRGGAAIVMGGLSPRTRNAQVELFQNGDVDYLVATDAIGMGLNMEINHIAFAALNKFDGKIMRDLRPDELAQIAGRAGRYMNDGTFGETGSAIRINPNIIEQIEEHKFDSIQNAQWRSINLDFSTLENLIISLNKVPEKMGLVKTPKSNDEKLLLEIIKKNNISSQLTNSSSVKLLWDVCQIPDFKKQIMGQHANLLAQIFAHLSKFGELKSDWIAQEVRGIDKTQGGIDALVDRISSIRIWTYISNRSKWLSDPEKWQIRTRQIEDRLSDALHQRLTQRFIDQRTSILMKKLKDRSILDVRVNSDNAILVEGQFIGHIKGIKFIPTNVDGAMAGRAIARAANRVLISEIETRIKKIIYEDGKNMSLDPKGQIFWFDGNNKQPIAVLCSSHKLLSPMVKLISSDVLNKVLKGKVTTYVQSWVTKHNNELLKPLFLAENSNSTGSLRGLLFQLIDSGGIITKASSIDQIRKLKSYDYGILKNLGIKIDRSHVYFPTLLSPKYSWLTSLLWALKNQLHCIPQLPSPGRVSVPYQSSVSKQFMLVAGYTLVGNLFIRIDILDKLLGILSKETNNGEFIVTPEVLNLLGCSYKDFGEMIKNLGYKRFDKGTTLENKKIYLFIKEKKRKSKKNFHTESSKKRKENNFISKTETPFSKLRDLEFKNIPNG